MQAMQAAAAAKTSGALQLISDVHVLDGSGQYLRPLAERELITDACFLRIFVALEEFLEATFAYYLTGGTSTAAWSPVTYAIPPTLEHAHRMFIGMRPFMDWSTPDNVRQLAHLYFENGEPFATPLASAAQYLKNMKTVRNATAHVSRTTQAALDAVHSQWTGTPTVGTTVYKTLLSMGASTHETFLATSEKTVAAVIDQIARRV